eukprot:scaffold49607_cov15-Tisochrysis_lutea.AAC.1
MSARLLRTKIGRQRLAFCQAAASEVWRGPCSVWPVNIRSCHSMKVGSHAGRAHKLSLLPENPAVSAARSKDLTSTVDTLGYFDGDTGCTCTELLVFIPPQILCGGKVGVQLRSMPKYIHTWAPPSIFLQYCVNVHWTAA